MSFRRKTDDRRARKHFGVIHGMDQERLSVFIGSLSGENTQFLEELERQAHSDYVPVIRRETQSLLKVLLQIKRPARILEIGTAVGFSAILMHTYCPVPCHITTIENYAKRIPAARENFRKAGCEEDITLLEGDAAQILPALEDAYDLVFMDAAKGQYMVFFREVMRLLAPGGILVADNVLQEGDILESRFGVTRRNRTIHSRMREFLHTVCRDERLTTVVLSDGDGVTVSVRK